MGGVRVSGRSSGLVGGVQVSGRGLGLVGGVRVSGRGSWSSQSSGLVRTHLLLRACEPFEMSDVILSYKHI